MYIGIGGIVLIILMMFGCVLAGYWLGFDNGYDYAKWESKDDDYL